MRALISVYDKDGLVEFSRELAVLGWEILASGGTSKVLSDAGIDHIEVASLTGFGSLLSGRVKTLHPAIHAGILADRDNPSHMTDLAEQDIEPIDLVVCNLYPFKSQPSIEMIDVGGPTMVRAAAKNFAHVGVIVNPDDYASVLDELKTLGELSTETRRRLAREAFAHTAVYDTAIVSWIDNGGLSSEDAAGGDTVASGAAAAGVTTVGAKPGGVTTVGATVGAAAVETTANEATSLPPVLDLDLELADSLKYGENPHQRGARYRVRGQVDWLDSMVQHAGRGLSYINLFDTESAWWLAYELKANRTQEQPGFEKGGNSEFGAVIVKHANPCGAALGSTMADAYRLALECDPVSAFGGVVAISDHCGIEVAEAMVEGPQADVIIAPSYDPQAIEMLVARRKATRLLEASPPHRPLLSVRSLGDSFLVQDNDIVSMDASHFEVVSEALLPEGSMNDVMMAWLVCARTTSNAIVVVNNEQAVGVGAGQQSRVEAAEIAVTKAGDRSNGGVAASDAFFPFRDGLDVLARAGIKVVVQPGGSVNDKSVIDAANEYGIAMVFTGERHFRH
ncbi:MAG: bifunctional phosphoribosylaminoimidazolecarboxamide formyltransferase/IMP cyclohydrolase [Actinobacteria bacterium]|nr:bifunctional phosphoribosylaminoimidazolecarboxamide formyltransferase/IMP cyclohydrolase [Actinomycetota bacterium]